MYDVKELEDYLFSPDVGNIELAFTIAPEQCEEICSQFQWLVDLGVVESCKEVLYLKGLLLYDKGLVELPSSIGKLTNLTWVSLWVNELTQLPNSIGNLTNLTELDLQENKLTQLPVSFAKLTNLKELSLSSNKLTELPECIGKLTNLRWLNLSENQLKDSEIECIKKALPNCKIY